MTDLMNRPGVKRDIVESMLKNGLHYLNPEVHPDGVALDTDDGDCRSVFSASSCARGMSLMLGPPKHSRRIFLEELVGVRVLVEHGERLSEHHGRRIYRILNGEEASCGRSGRRSTRRSVRLARW